MAEPRRRRFLISAALLVAAPLSRAGAEGTTHARIGVLLLADAPRLKELLLQPLRDLGWTEDQNLTVAWRSANGVRAKLAEYATELAGTTDLVIAASNFEALAMQRASRRIPVVVFLATDPVAQGFAQSLAHPGGNMTGCVWPGASFTAKAIQLMKETVPDMQRLGEIYPADPFMKPYLDSVESSAGDLGITLLRFPVRGVEEIEPTLQAMKNEHVDAIRVVTSGAPQARLDQILAFANANKIPTSFTTGDAVARGGLMAYTPSFAEASRLVAERVDKILKGAKPGDLPFEQVTRYTLIINLRTAKEIGVTVPQTVMFQADRVIQ